MDTVVILHGLWLGPTIMQPLAKRVERQGFKVNLFKYKSVKRSPQENAKKLGEFVDKIEANTIHFVAHSLGGVVLLNYLSQTKCSKAGHLVLLGSPISGSRKAIRISRLPFGRKLLGKSIKGLINSPCICPENNAVGVIAGSIPMGLGLLLGPFFKTNDGVVALDETQAQGVNETKLIRTSHTGMLMNRKVAQQVVHFLKFAHFSN